MSDQVILALIAGVVTITGGIVTATSTVLLKRTDQIHKVVNGTAQANQARSDAVAEQKQALEVLLAERDARIVELMRALDASAPRPKK